MSAAVHGADGGKNAAEKIALQLEMRFPDLAKVSGQRRLSGGSSHETWAFDAVLRGKEPAKPTPFILRREFELALFDMTLSTEFELMRKLHQAGVPVPWAHFVSTDGRAGEPPLMVMERVSGLDTRKAMAASPHPGGRRAIGVALVDALAMLHAQPIDPIRGILGGGSVRAELEKWRAIVVGSGSPSALLHLALAWLSAHCPVDSALAIVHGDYKANNILLEEGTRPVIIDWELAHIGDRLEDLAWTMLWNTPDDLVGGMLTPTEFLAEYERASGVAVDRGLLHFWKLFSLVKLAAIFLKGIESASSGRAPRPTLLMLAQALPSIEEALAALLMGGSRQGGAA